MKIKQELKLLKIKMKMQMKMQMKILIIFWNRFQMIITLNLSKIIIKCVTNKNGNNICKILHAKIMLTIIN